MTLPTSGSISTDQIMAELRVANPERGYPLNTLDADVLALAGKSGPPVAIPGDFYGKSTIVPMTVTAINDSGSANSQFSGGIVSCSPGVSITGGKGVKTCAWVVLSNPMGCDVTLGTGPTVSVRYAYFKNSIGSAEVLLRCTVTDEAGTQRTVDNISGTLEWMDNR